jgi:hypothetical protein
MAKHSRSKKARKRRSWGTNGGDPNPAGAKKVKS